MYLLTNPFGEIWGKKDYCVHLDSIYILTLSNRPMPITDLNFLLQYSNEIVLLFSDKPANWTKNLSNTVRIECVRSNIFSKEYLSRLENQNIAIKWRPNFDIPLKRSFALFDAKNKNFKNILLLDDDILMSKGNMQAGLSGLTYNKALIGFHVTDYPDVSTIDHIDRLIQKKDNIISMTGSCLFINVEQTIGDFPLIYNEDLFFFMKQANPQNIVSGGTIIQKEYTPWARLDRVKHEQFGDLIYEAFKKRFIGTDESVIKWEDEIILRLNRIKQLINKSYQETFKKSLCVAYEGTNEINTKDISEFIARYEFAAWVNKYL